MFSTVKFTLGERKMIKTFGVIAGQFLSRVRATAYIKSIATRFLPRIANVKFMWSLGSLSAHYLCRYFTASHAYSMSYYQTLLQMVNSIKKYSLLFISYKEIYQTKVKLFITLCVTTIQLHTLLPQFSIMRILVIT